jgi:hypothetical protein
MEVLRSPPLLLCLNSFPLDSETTVLIAAILHARFHPTPQRGVKTLMIRLIADGLLLEKDPPRRVLVSDKDESFKTTLEVALKLFATDGKAARRFAADVLKAVMTFFIKCKPPLFLWRSWQSPIASARLLKFKSADKIVETLSFRRQNSRAVITDVFPIFLNDIAFIQCLFDRFLHSVQSWLLFHQSASDPDFLIQQMILEVVRNGSASS